jgi:hypothetical protein
VVRGRDLGRFPQADSPRRVIQHENPDVPVRVPGVLEARRPLQLYRLPGRSRAVRRRSRSPRNRNFDFRRFRRANRRACMRRYRPRNRNSDFRRFRPSSLSGPKTPIPAFDEAHPRPLGPALHPKVVETATRSACLSLVGNGHFPHPAKNGATMKRSISKKTDQVIPNRVDPSPSEIAAKTSGIGACDLVRWLLINPIWYQ